MEAGAHHSRTHSRLCKLFADASKLWSDLIFAVDCFKSKAAADLHSRRAYHMHHTMLQSILYVHIANRCTLVSL